MHHLDTGIQTGARVRFRSDINLAPYGVLLAGSTGSVKHLDAEVVSILLDKALPGFGDTLEAMSDNADVVAALAVHHPSVMSRMRRPLRLAVAATLVVFMWEAALKPATALTAYLPEPLYLLLNGF
jgi:hypothetical protein